MRERRGEQFREEESVSWEMTEHLGKSA